MALLVVFDVALAFDRKHVTCPKKPLARKLLGMTNVPFFKTFRFRRILSITKMWTLTLALYSLQIVWWDVREGKNIQPPFTEA